jgi:hypothetical protein
LPSDAALSRVAGWTELRRAMQSDPWPDWFRIGREVWAGWHALDPAPAQEDETSGSIPNTKEVPRELAR